MQPTISPGTQVSGKTISNSKPRPTTGIYPKGLVRHIRRLSPEYSKLSSLKIGFITSLLYVNYFHPMRFKHNRGNGFFVYSKAAQRILGKNYATFLDPIVYRDRYYVEGSCKRATLRPEAISLIENYLIEDSPSQLMENGKAINITGKVRSRDTNGNNAIARFNLQPAVPGTSEDVFRLVRFLSEAINHIVGWGEVPRDAQSYRWMLSHQIDPLNSDNLEKLQAIRDQGKTIIDLANSRYFPSNGIPSIPIETGTGRIIYQHPSLQSTRKVIRDCYLGGNFDIDIDSAHPAFALEAANRHGIKVPALTHYITNKNAVRRTISNKTGLSIPLVKQSILAVSYGAKKAIRKGSAIYDSIAAEEISNPEHYASTLFEDEIFSELANDLRKAQKAVIAEFLKPVNRSVYLQNAIGKTIRRDEPKASLAAHALQGLEAKFLHIAHDILGSEILLLMHDGIVTRSEVDQEQIEQKFLNETGIKITLKQKRLPTLNDA